MNNSSKFLDECRSFAEEHAPEIVAQELVKPYPDSLLHEKTIEVLQAEVFESRRLQHLIPQFSEEESKHFQFLDEATAILEFKRLDELSKTTLGGYIKKSADKLADGSFKSGAAAAMQTPEAERKKQRQTNNNRYSGILKATRRLTKENADQLDELSTKTLSDYREKSSQEVGSYKFGAKAPTMKMSDVQKRIKGFVSAGGKIKAKNTKTNIQSEEVEQIEEAMSLVKTYSSPSKSKEAKVYKDKEWGEFRVKHFIDGQHQAKADYHTDDLDDAHGTAKQHIKESLGEAAMPLRGHDYHTKSDASLNYIIKDAGEARDALGNDHPSNGKYSDQINDAHTVLHYRKNGGQQIKEPLKEGFDKSGARNRIKNLLG